MKKSTAVIIWILAIMFATGALGASMGDMFKDAVTRGVIYTAANRTAQMVKSHRATLNAGTDHALNSYSAILMTWGTTIDTRWGKDGFEKMTCARGRANCKMSAGEKQQMRQWRNSLFADARSYFKNPDVLWSTYQTHKQTIIEGVKAAGGQTEMREYLSVISKYFSSDQNVRVEMHRSLAAYKAATSKGENAPDWYAYEFAERRRSEGGDKLVQMYNKIIIDLAASLQ